MSRTSPQAVAKSVERLHPLLAKLPVDESVKQRLCALVGGEDRHYHGIDHLALLWERHRLYCAEAALDRPDVDTMVACAVAFHDAVYDARRHDNEARSTELWLETSANSPISEVTRNWVADTILATRDHLSYVPPGALPYEVQPLPERVRLWFLDLDLTPIGEEPAEFALNTARLREESPGLPDADKETGRLRFLARLAAHPRIFRTPVLADVFEAKARANLARELG